MLSWRCLLAGWGAVAYGAPAIPSAINSQMASPLAYEQPSLNKAWEGLLLHVPTIVVIWLVSVVLSVVGFGVSLLISVIGAAIAGQGASSDAVAGGIALLSQLGQLPFGILASLVGVLFVAVPAMYYASGETITASAAFQSLMRRPWRYFLAGLLFSVVTAIGFILCILPGIAVSLVAPVFVNLVFNTDRSIGEAFSASFQAVYRSPQGFTFIGIQILAWIVVVLFSVCTCGVGALVAVPMANFFIQNAAYHRGVIS